MYSDWIDMLKKYHDVQKINDTKVKINDLFYNETDEKFMPVILNRRSNRKDKVYYIDSLGLKYNSIIEVLGFKDQEEYNRLTTNKKVRNL